jgi:hypothetical protein
VSGNVCRVDESFEAGGDVSEPMLDRLRNKVARLGLSYAQMVQAGFLTYEHVRAPADFIYSRYALHHLPGSLTAALPAGGCGMSG